MFRLHIEKHFGFLVGSLDTRFKLLHPPRWPQPLPQLPSPQSSTPFTDTFHLHYHTHHTPPQPLCITSSTPPSPRYDLPSTPPTRTRAPMLTGPQPSTPHCDPHAIQPMHTAEANTLHRERRRRRLCKKPYDSRTVVAAAVARGDTQRHRHVFTHTQTSPPLRPSPQPPLLAPSSPVYTYL